MPYTKTADGVKVTIGSITYGQSVDTLVCISVPKVSGKDVKERTFPVVHASLAYTGNVRRTSEQSQGDCEGKGTGQLGGGVGASAGDGDEDKCGKAKVAKVMGYVKSDACETADSDGVAQDGANNNTVSSERPCNIITATGPLIRKCATSAQLIYESLEGTHR